MDLASTGDSQSSQLRPNCQISISVGLCFAANFSCYIGYPKLGVLCLGLGFPELFYCPKYSQPTTCLFLHIWFCPGWYTFQLFQNLEIQNIQHNFFSISPGNGGIYMQYRDLQKSFATEYVMQCSGWCTFHPIPSTLPPYYTVLCSC